MYVVPIVVSKNKSRVYHPSGTVHVHVKVTFFKLKTCWFVKAYITTGRT